MRKDNPGIHLWVVARKSLASLLIWWWWWCRWCWWQWWRWQWGWWRWWWWRWWWWWCGGWLLPCCDFRISLHMCHSWSREDTHIPVDLLWGFLTKAIAIAKTITITKMITIKKITISACLYIYEQGGVINNLRTCFPGHLQYICHQHHEGAVHILSQPNLFVLEPTPSSSSSL